MRTSHPEAQYANQYLSKAAEYTVAAQFLLRGISVHFPAADLGTDLIVGRKIRIQVKSRWTKLRDGYPFTIGSSHRRDRDGKINYSVRDWTKVADFIICWAAPENRFWIIPTVAIPKNIAILCLGYTPHWKFDGEAIKRLHKSGMSGAAIAREIGCSESTVSAVLRGRIKKPVPSFSNSSSKYEGAWHLIESSLSMVEDLDSTVAEEIHGTSLSKSV